MKNKLIKKFKKLSLEEQSNLVFDLLEQMEVKEFNQLRLGGEKTISIKMNGKKYGQNENIQSK